MRNIIFITINFAILVLLLTLIDWFEIEQLKVEAINRQYKKNIKKMEKVSQINKWINNDIFPIIKTKQNSSQNSDENLITFFDDNVNKYNFIVSRYIYSENISKNIDLSYSLNRGDKDQLANFVNMKFKNGFLEFRELKMDESSLKGTIKVVQQYNGESNVSK
ncbi:hypothetical protein [Sulfurimonas sp.]|jgi:hypothetical protein|uniref:hypothetical protein n=1 Tax=Sulfurimonas sp. TaxID=2022749 RepID=UPI0025D483C4|nr:hypothetical protein [Sulfurimonas sp.]MBT5934273.1 hypothetical protein [Sulfurimonas sp.]